MFKVSAFITMSALANNAPGLDSTLGELSNESATFSRDIGKYSLPTTPNVRLLTFDCRRNDKKTVVEPNYLNVILPFGEWLYERSIDGTLSDNVEACRQAVVAEFSTKFDILSLGRMVTNGTYWLPEFIFIKKKDESEDNVIRLWFSDPAFRVQYDLYEIVVIPPVEPLDDLHKARNIVIDLLNKINIPEHLEKEKALTNQFPETMLNSTNYDWVDKNDPTVRHATPWTVAIYGSAGNNADIIRQTLMEYILANSTQPASEWEKIYPDLFRPTEYFIAPIWDRYSLPNREIQAGLYSPTLPYRHIMDYAKQLIPTMEPEYLEANLCYFSTVLKGLGFIAIGNPRNRHEAFRFDERWPTYIDLSPSSNDFNRIPPDVQEFIMTLLGLLTEAENMTEYSQIPLGTTKITRDGIEYLAKSYDRELYLVALKSNDLTIPLPVPQGE